MSQKNNRRWRFIILSFLICLALGVIYTWSVFRIPLEKKLSITPLESLYPFMLQFVIFVFAFIIFEKLIHWLSARLMVIIGGIFFGFGWLIAGFIHDKTTFTLLFGLFTGIGNGFLYNCAIAQVAQWFPDKKGIALGTSLIGAAISPLFTAPLAHVLITRFGVLAAFKIFGSGIIIVLFIIALFCRYPASGWKPAGFTSEKAEYIKKQNEVPVNIRSFWSLWFCYLIGMFTGIMAIAISNPFGQEEFYVSARIASLYVACFSFFCAVARPVFGYLTDHMGIRFASLLDLIMLLTATLLLVFLISTREVWVFIVSFSAYWACFSGWLVTGFMRKGVVKLKNISVHVNRLLITALGLGAILGNLIPGYCRVKFGTYIPVFYIIAGLVVIGIIVAFLGIKNEDG